jgi:Ternary complex associated domain 9
MEKRNMEILYNNLNPDIALLNLKIDGKSIRGNKALYQELQSEWLDLLQCLFSGAQGIGVEPMKPGFSGASVIGVRPFFEQGEGHKVVVKFGDVHDIKQEHANYTTYVQSFIGGEHSTVILEKCYLSKLGGIVYNFLGAASDSLQDFSEFYHYADIVKLRQALDNLFRHACRLWYASTTTFRPLNLTELYQKQFHYSLKNLKDVVSKYQPQVQYQKVLNFSSLGCTSTSNFTNPLYALKDTQPFVCSSYMATTHGDLNKNNIFIDKNGHTYLIDFGRTGFNHILRDVAMLDSVIRFQLLSTGEATFDERLKMEEILCSISRFSEIDQLTNEFSTTNMALMKAFQAVVHLRTLAQWIVERKPEDDMREYYVGLLYNALDTLRFSSLGTTSRAHALLSASLLVDRLGIGNNKR